MSQETNLLNHLKTQGPISPLKALKLYGCLRLAARCYDLRCKGYDIKMRWVDNGKKRYGEYYL